MLIENTFKMALIASLGLHTFLLMISAHFDVPILGKTDKNIEVVYLKPKAEPKAKNVEIHKAQEPIKPQLLKLSQNKISPPPYIQRQEAFSQKQLEINKPVMIRIDDALSKTKIDLPPITSDKIKNPSYLNYYQLIREKIKRAAYQNYNRNDTGEVYLSFVISAGGALKAVHLIEDKSTENHYLRDISIRSIQSAGPFPAFPRELPYAELSFNIIISFDLE